MNSATSNNEIQQETELIHYGILLKEARQSRNLTLEDVHSHLHINVRVLAAFEEGRFQKIEDFDDVYLRSYCLKYATYLGLDKQEYNDKVYGNYTNAGMKIKKVLVDQPPSVPPTFISETYVNRRPPSRSKITIFLAVTVVFIALMSYIILHSLQGGQSSSTSGEVDAQVTSQQHETDTPSQSQQSQEESTSVQEPDSTVTSAYQAHVDSSASQSTTQAATSQQVVDANGNVVPAQGLYIVAIKSDSWIGCYDDKNRALSNLVLKQGTSYHNDTDFVKVSYVRLGVGNAVQIFLNGQEIQFTNVGEKPINVSLTGQVSE